MGEANNQKQVYRAAAGREGLAPKAPVQNPPLQQNTIAFPGGGQAGAGKRGNRKKKRRMDLPFIAGLLVLTLGLGAAGLLAWDRSTGGELVDNMFAFGAAALPPDGPWTEEDALLGRTQDAGAAYVQDTLFLGDSNTERLQLLRLVELENIAAHRAIGVTAVVEHPCVYYEGKAEPLTIPEAVALAQPRRVLMTFGTNDIADGTSQRAFIGAYRQAIEAIRRADPYCDIIVNAIPPAAEDTLYTSVGREKVRAYNAALLAMCAEEEVYFLNSYEALADDQGYCRKGYAIGDGLHLSQEGLEALLEYHRTHALHTEDTRPAANRQAHVRRATPYADPVSEPEAPAEGAG